MSTLKLPNGKGLGNRRFCVLLGHLPDLRKGRNDGGREDKVRTCTCTAAAAVCAPASALPCMRGPNWRIQIDPYPINASLKPFRHLSAGKLVSICLLQSVPPIPGQPSAASRDPGGRCVSQRLHLFVRLFRSHFAADEVWSHQMPKSTPGGIKTNVTASEWLYRPSRGLIEAFSGC